jgi:hypothetical protein
MAQHEDAAGFGQLGKRQDLFSLCDTDKQRDEKAGQQ